MSSKRNWKILYSNYVGAEKKAVELVQAEVGKFILRDPGVYTLHVLECAKMPSELDKNVIIVSTYNEIVAEYVNENEIPENGYLIKVFDNPKNSDLQIVLITAREDYNVFYGAVDFVDDYPAVAAPVSGGLRTPCEMYDGKLPSYEYASAPTAKTRSIFTWGHPINDYRSYIENIARLKINQLIVWNDFLPINAKEIVDYAHEYNIELFWGFPWGWDTNCAEIDLDALDAVKDDIVRTFREIYDGAGDGIYFQSFTELHQDKLGDTVIAEAVANFVNSTARELFEIRPELRIQFGLHAISVKEHLEYIADVDERIEIVWEDCGTFPYHYLPVVKDEDEFNKTLEFTDKILNLRKRGKTGLVYKGMMTMDWSKFVHQSGPYIMGKASREIIESDKEMLKPIWAAFRSEWLTNGKYAYLHTQEVYKKTNGDINLCIAGALDGGIWFPEALCAQILWNCTEPYETILEKVAKRQCVTI